MNIQKNIGIVLAHRKNVVDSAIMLGNYDIEKGDVGPGIDLISNALVHDVSKLKNYVENRFFVYGEEKYKQVAIERHRVTNAHHPEYWGGIEHMPDISLKEMVCDWKARSSEKATDLREWIKTEATDRFKFNITSDLGNKIMFWVDIITEPPFERI